MSPRHEAATYSSLQFSGPEVVVKNTFIEVQVEEEGTPVPRSQRPRRAKTQPQVSFGSIPTEDEATDSDVPTSKFVSEDGTSEPEEAAVMRAATERASMGRSQPDAAHSWQLLPELGGGELKVVVKNTFLDIDLRTPSARRTERSKTAPNVDSGPLADLGCLAAEEEEEDEDEDKEDEEDSRHGCGSGGASEVSNAQQAEFPGEEEEEAEPPVERVATHDWYESPQAWEWVPGMRMPLEPWVLRPTGRVNGLPEAEVPQAQLPAQAAAAPARPPAVAPLPEAQTHPGAPSCGDARGRAPAPGNARGGAPAPAMQVPASLSEAVSLSSGDSGFFRVHWTVDARKLRGNDKQVVSPPFDLALGPNSRSPVPFKMMIYPKIEGSTRPGASFKSSCGRGYVQLKCEAEQAQSAADVVLRISLGDGKGLGAPRGPVQHDFLASGVCGLPRGQEIWDFSAAVDQRSMTFCVCLEIALAKAP